MIVETMLIKVIPIQWDGRLGQTGTHARPPVAQVSNTEPDRVRTQWHPP